MKSATWKVRISLFLAVGLLVFAGACSGVRPVTEQTQASGQAQIECPLPDGVEAPAGPSVTAQQVEDGSASLTEFALAVRDQFVSESRGKTTSEQWAYVGCLFRQEGSPWHFGSTYLVELSLDGRVFLHTKDMALSGRQLNPAVYGAILHALGIDPTSLTDPAAAIAAFVAAAAGDGGPFDAAGVPGASGYATAYPLATGPRVLLVGFDLDASHLVPISEEALDYGDPPIAASEVVDRATLKAFVTAAGAYVVDLLESGDLAAVSKARIILRDPSGPWIDGPVYLSIMDRVSRQIMFHGGFPNRFELRRGGISRNVVTGELIVDQLIAAAESGPEGGFFEYYFDNPDDDSDSADIPKVGYARVFTAHIPLPDGTAFTTEFIMNSGFYLSADAHPTSGQTPLACPLPDGIDPPATPQVTAQQVEDGSASLTDFALAVRDQFVSDPQRITTLEETAHIGCLFRQEGSPWRSGSTYLVELTPDGRVFLHAKDMALSGRQLKPAIYGAILHALGIAPAALTDPAAAMTAFAAAAAGDGGPFDAAGVAGASGYATVYGMQNPRVLVVGFDLDDSHLIPISEEALDYGDPPITASDVVDRATLKAFVTAAGEYSVRLLESGDLAALSKARVALRDPNGPWRDGPVYLSVMDHASRQIMFHGGFPDRFELRRGGISRNVVTGELIVDQLVAAAESGPEGGFFEYYFDNPADDSDSADIPKVGYARVFTANVPLPDGSSVPFNIIVNSGFYLSTDAHAASGEPQDDCPLIERYVPPVTAQQVEDGSASLKEFALAVSDQRGRMNINVVCLIRKEGSPWRSGSTYLIRLTPDGRVYTHAKDMSLSGRLLNPVIYAAILQALGIDPASLSDPAAARDAFAAAAAGGGGPFDVPGIAGASGYATIIHSESGVLQLAGFDLSESHLIPISDEEIDYGDPPIAAGEVVDRETLKAFVTAAGEYFVEVLESGDMAAASRSRIGMRDPNGPWRHGSIYISVMERDSKLILFHGGFPDRFEYRKGGISRDAATGELVVDQLIAAAESGPEGGFWDYYFDNPDDDTDSAVPKVGYARVVTVNFTLPDGRVHPIDYIINSGFYLSTDAQAEAGQAQDECPLPEGVELLLQAPRVTAQQVEDGSASLTDFALAVRDNFGSGGRGAAAVSKAIYFRCLFRQEGSPWRSGSTYLVQLTLDGRILVHAKEMALSGRQLDPAIYGAILHALGIDPAALTDPTAAMAALTTAAAGDGGPFDVPGIPGASGYASAYTPINVVLAGFDLDESHLVPISEEALDYGDPPITASDVVDRATLKAFVTAAGEYVVKLLESGEGLRANTKARIVLRDPNGPWRDGPVYVAMMERASKLITFHGAFPNRFELRRGGISRDIATGELVVDQLIAAAESGPEGGFWDYYFDNPDDDTDSAVPKVGYARIFTAHIPLANGGTLPYEFIVNSGFYPDADAHPASGQTQDDCPLPDGVEPPQAPRVTAQQVEDGSASLTDFALAVRDNFGSGGRGAEAVSKAIYFRCLFRQEGSPWRSGSTYLVQLTLDGRILVHAKEMALSGRQLNPAIYGAILHALGIDPAALTDPTAAMAALTTAAAGDGGPFDAAGVAGATGYASVYTPFNVVLAGFDLDESHLVPISEEALDYGDPPITASDVVDRATLKAFVTAAGEYVVKLLESGEGLRANTKARIVLRDPNGPWRDGPVYVAMMERASKLITFHGAFPNRFELRRGGISRDIATGELVVDQLIAAAESGPEGGFWDYYFDNPDDDTDSAVPKVGYARIFTAHIPLANGGTLPYEFIVNSGFYPDADAHPASGQTQDDCPLPDGVEPPQAPRVTAQQVEDGSASLTEFALAVRDNFGSGGRGAAAVAKAIYFRCLFRQEGSPWRSGSTYLVQLTLDGRILVHAKEMALSGRQLDPAIYGAILHALGIDPAALTDPTAAMAALTTAAAGDGGPFDAAGVAGATGYASVYTPFNVVLAGFDLDESHLVPISEEALDYGDPPITASDVVDRATLKAFVTAAGEYVVKLLESGEGLRANTKARIVLRDPNGPWRDGPVYVAMMERVSKLITFHGAFPNRFELRRGGISRDIATGELVVDQLIAAAESGPEGGFWDYYFDNPDDDTDSAVPKVGYARIFTAHIPLANGGTLPYEFIVNSGFYPSSDAHPASGQAQLACPLPDGVAPPAAPPVTAQQVEDGNASLTDFALAVRDQFLSGSQGATTLEQSAYVGCLFRQEGSPWRSGSTYLVELTPDGRVFLHAKDMALSGRQLDPAVYGAILHAMGNRPGRPDRPGRGHDCLRRRGSRGRRLV